jgi:hypothetical protein
MSEALPDYYARKPSVGPGGHRTILQQPCDRKNEENARQRLEAAWNCKIHPFGRYNELDWWAERDGKCASVLEYKRRSHSFGDFPDSFIPFHKWLALTLGEYGLRVPAILVLEFDDSLRYCLASEIAASRVMIRRTNHSLKLATNVEPVFRIPLDLLHEVK